MSNSNSAKGGKRISEFAEQYKQALGIVAVLLIVVGLAFSLYWFGLIALRYTLISLLTILPALMYFVFIALRKTSLFHEYISNLYQLGLLNYFDCGTRSNIENARLNEKQVEYFNRSRIQGYLKRFESVYGPVKEELVEELLSAAGSLVAAKPDFKDSQISRGDSSGIIFSLSTAIPVFTATVLIAVGWMMFLPPLNQAERTGDVAMVVEAGREVVVFGFLGAYFFSLQMLFRRFVVNDLRAKAYISVSIRIVLAIIGAWVLLIIPAVDGIGTEVQPNTTTVTSGYLLLFAFVIGVFPPVLWRYIRTVISKVQLISVPDFANKLPVTSLDGLTIWHQARLEEEDIENGFNMANADIVQLMLNSKVPSDRIIDWVDQAILLSCICRTGDENRGNPLQFNVDKNRFQELGIRTATMLDLYKDNKGEVIDDALARLQRRGATPEDVKQLIAIAGAVENYTNLGLLRSWKGSKPSSTSTGPQIARLDHTISSTESAGATG